jgi:hypothetical protein
VHITGLQLLCVATIPFPAPEFVSAGGNESIHLFPADDLGLPIGSGGVRDLGEDLVTVSRVQPVCGCCVLQRGGEYRQRAHVERRVGGRSKRGGPVVSSLGRELATLVVLEAERVHRSGNQTVDPPLDDVLDGGRQERLPVGHERRIGCRPERGRVDPVGLGELGELDLPHVDQLRHRVVGWSPDEIDVNVVGLPRHVAELPGEHPQCVLRESCVHL